MSAIDGLCMLFIVVILTLCIAVACDGRDGRAGDVRRARETTLYTDPGTGCQYVSGTYGEALTPRLDKSGRQVCSEVERGAP